jgi:hypothetical protein
MDATQWGVVTALSVSSLYLSKNQTDCARLSRRPGERSAAKQMQVDVKDGLACAAVRVEERSVPRFRKPPFLRDRRGPPHQLADEPIVLGADFVQRFDMAFRDHQYVRRRLGIDVVEREHTFVFVDEARGDFTLDDFAEEAVGHGR